MDPIESKQEDRISPYPTRLDRRDLLGIMSAIIYSGIEQSSKAAVDTAFEIDRMVGDKLRLLKSQKRNSAAIQRRQPKPLTPDEISEGEAHEVSRTS
jgi:hypothetical protein